jgi:hypothetical protein
VRETLLLDFVQLGLRDSEEFLAKRKRLTVSRGRYKVRPVGANIRPGLFTYTVKLILSIGYLTVQRQSF